MSERMTQPGRAEKPGAPAPDWLPNGAYIEDGMVIYRDQGWTFEEWAAKGLKPRTRMSDEERRRRDCEYQRRHRQELKERDPEAYRAWRSKETRRWRERNRERVRRYNREWMRCYRAEKRAA